MLSAKLNSNEGVKCFFKVQKIKMYGKRF